ncbi:SPOR domain-containing protein [bacterium]|nr:SPOR domain-containing protein [bacterium]
MPGVLRKEEPLAYPYSIYLGSYRILDSAQKAVSQYEKRGLFTYWVKVHLGKKGVWFRIFTGWFSKKKQAEEYIKKMNVSNAVIKKTGYSALIGIYSSKKELDRGAVELLKFGLCPYTIERMNGTSQLYSGAFITRAGSERHHSELASMGIESKVVER